MCLISIFQNVIVPLATMVILMIFLKCLSLFWSRRICLKSILKCEGPGGYDGDLYEFLVMENVSDSEIHFSKCECPVGYDGNLNAYCWQWQ